MALGEVVADEDEEREKPAEETCDFCPSSQLPVASESWSRWQSPKIQGAMEVS